MKAEKPSNRISPNMPHSAGLDRDIVGIMVARTKPKDLRALYEFIGAIGGAGECLRNPEKIRKYESLYHLLCDQTEVNCLSSKITGWGKRGIGVIPYDSSHYPPLLREIYEPPAVLFYRGVLPSEWSAKPCIAIVGSRNSDRYGTKIASELGRAVVRNGGCVVSGLALGIDGSAHRGALDECSDCPTIAVLGSGVNQITPTTHTPLGEKILENGGLILSQFEPGAAVFPTNFLDRNRVIAGISLGVIVVQARARSGALVTARFAMTEGREVMAVPGPIDTPRCEGSNSLLFDGAHIIRNVDDILDYIPSLKRSLAAKIASSTENAPALALLNVIRELGPIHIEELKKRGPSQNFQATLLELELHGAIERLPGNLIALT